MARITVHQRNTWVTCGHEHTSDWHAVEAGPHSFWMLTRDIMLRALRHQFRKEWRTPSWPKVIEDDGGWFQEWRRTGGADRAYAAAGRLDLLKLRTARLAWQETKRKLKEAQEC